LAELGSAKATNCTRIRVVLGSGQDVAGEAECATTQTAHCASSRELECWCAAKPYADTDISSRQSHAVGLKTDRMKLSPSRTVIRIYTEIAIDIKGFWYLVLHSEARNRQGFQGLPPFNPRCAVCSLAVQPILIGSI